MSPSKPPPPSSSLPPALSLTANSFHFPSSSCTLYKSLTFAVASEHPLTLTASTELLNITFTTPLGSVHILRHHENGLSDPTFPFVINI